MYIIYMYIDNEGYIKEYTNVEMEGFIKTDFTFYDLPKDVTKGFYKLVEGEIVLDEEKKVELYGEVEVTKEEYDALVKRLDVMQKALDDLIIGGAL